MISTKGRYAIRAMIDIAEHQNSGLVTLKDISERQDISKKYLEIIMKDLTKAGFVIGVSGKGGGYKLCRKPNKYTIKEILEQMEGTLSSVACLAENAPSCPRAKQCKTLPMWKEVDSMVNSFFQKKRLSDLL